MRIKISENGERYTLDSSGYVLEYSNRLKEDPSSESRKTWQITGVWWSKGFGRYYMTLNQLIEGLREGKLSLQYKNGKTKYRLTDLDHGTRRLHSGGPATYGVTSIYMAKE